MSTADHFQYCNVSYSPFVCLDGSAGKPLPIKADPSTQAAFKSSGQLPRGSPSLLIPTAAS